MRSALRMKRRKINPDCPFGFSGTHCNKCQLYMDGDCMQEIGEINEGIFDDSL